MSVIQVQSFCTTVVGGISIDSKNQIDILIDTLLSYGVPPRIGIEPWVMRGDASIADTRHKIIYGLLRPWNASVPQSLIDHSIIYSEYPIIRR